jgi:hypothetical protein
VRANKLTKRKEMTTMTMDTTRTLIEAGLLPDAAHLSAADRQAIGELTRDEVDAIVAMRCKLGNDPSKQDGHVAYIWV